MMAACSRTRETVFSPNSAASSRQPAVKSSGHPRAAPRLDFRIGIHLGDVIAESDGDLMGDGVNVAVRIEGAAAVGGISLSRAAYEQVRDRLDVAFIDRGEVLLKNIARPVHVFDVANLGAAPTRAAEAPKALALPDKPSIAVLPFQNMSGDPEQEYFAVGMVEDIITGAVAHRLAVRHRAQ